MPLDTLLPLPRGRTDGGKHQVCPGCSVSPLYGLQALVTRMVTRCVGFQVMVEEGDNLSQGSGHESTLELDSSDFSQFDSQDPDKALTLVRSVMARKRQAVQVRTPAFPPPRGWYRK